MGILAVFSSSSSCEPPGLCIRGAGRILQKGTRRGLLLVGQFAVLGQFIEPGYNAYQAVKFNGLLSALNSIFQ